MIPTGLNHLRTCWTLFPEKKLKSYAAEYRGPHPIAIKIPLPGVAGWKRSTFESNPGLAAARAGRDLALWTSAALAGCRLTRGAAQEGRGLALVPLDGRMSRTGLRAAGTASGWA